MNKLELITEAHILLDSIEDLLKFIFDGIKKNENNN